MTGVIQKILLGSLEQDNDSNNKGNDKKNKLNPVSKLNHWGNKVTGITLDELTNFKTLSFF